MSQLLVHNLSVVLHSAMVILLGAAFVTLPPFWICQELLIKRDKFLPAAVLSIMWIIFALAVLMAAAAAANNLSL